MSSELCHMKNSLWNLAIRLTFLYFKIKMVWNSWSCITSWAVQNCCFHLAIKKQRSLLGQYFFVAVIFNLEILSFKMLFERGISIVPSHSIKVDYEAEEVNVWPNKERLSSENWDLCRNKEKLWKGYK